MAAGEMVGKANHKRRMEEEEASSKRMRSKVNIWKEIIKEEAGLIHELKDKTTELRSSIK